MSLEEKIKQIDCNRLPKHVAVIMDGNGRWAKQRNLDRSFGHIEGVTAVRNITEIASDLGIGSLTLFIAIAIEKETPDLIKNNVRLKIIGDLTRVPEFAREKLEGCVKATEASTGMNMILAISYSARWEITNAVKKIASDVADGKIKLDGINEETVGQYLTTAGIPDPDLLIRTGGDCRISNYLLWQIAYAELYFTDKFWPDFSKEDFCDAIIKFQSRERRFGKTSEQVQEK